MHRPTILIDEGGTRPEDTSLVSHFTSFSHFLEFTMANKLHEEWKKAKKSLEDQVAAFKKKGGHNPAEIEAALKSFTQDLGGTLDKAADAYKGNKGADVQKYATKALGTVNAYFKKCAKISNERGGYASRILKAMCPKLEELEAKGMTAANPF
jgi:hypothetical protein